MLREAEEGRIYIPILNKEHWYKVQHFMIGNGYRWFAPGLKPYGTCIGPPTHIFIENVGDRMFYGPKEDEKYNKGEITLDLSFLCSKRS